MGFLNNTTVTVDAILTKKGRELLAQGTEAFNITKFALADDEVDYNLWDVTHPNGSDYYGKVIENMPLLEAIPDENHVMRYKLVTLPKTTTKMPVLKLQGIGATSITFDNQDSENQSATVGAVTNNVADSSYTFILHDQSVAQMTVSVEAGSGATGQQFFLGADEASNSQTEVGMEVKIKVLKQTAASVTQLTIVGNDTGATSSVPINNNLVTVA
jgi:hypothetical protein